MQIIEVTGYADRSAVITMRRTQTPLEFVIFPMLHVASPTLYSQVRLRPRECDLIVVEGIRGRSVGASALTLVYQFAPRRRRNGLQEQRDELVLPEGVPLVNPDVPAAEAVADLKTLPRWRYVLLILVAPVRGLMFASMSSWCPWFPRPGMRGAASRRTPNSWGGERSRLPWRSPPWTYANPPQACRPAITGTGA
ncbi:hypothetical protein [Streptomyces sp. NPDC001980]|uniref:hypothetical protein n=1 Tax=Streptomyces sp. NPDC001980 TaxID=3157126 RepID=UPI0033225F32